ncbi:D-alanyl-D-alanine carboxypeptidase/D-alanyl-D-alanine-endopeptidase [Nocardioides sp. Kera G14]|uniref:D-alanyl-D-alanine carboxypeptidase/D-alanyl-D-alanine endopeptidase n=1 Tax=Nocardioides sp. Kera G14 TaxID=2884264 RepID=UPI001D10873B|nr:D-alanyl-D-alanine carboxypeptidase/D-alanyl-D-alanine-endopeptidase [Nocardioides sp. Kera G14]UDY23838.1 D-alanyl-D-alanine carboxypeptidase/D-alanyl-D-alanine-endopeptidase [Nocardioides sp. Kera G14]
MRKKRRLRWVAPLLIVLVLLVGAGAAGVQRGWVDDLRMRIEGHDAAAPAAAAEPWESPVPSPTALAGTPTPDPAKVRAALTGQLTKADLGPHVLVEVAGLSGDPIVTSGSGSAVPASTNKLLTTAAGLHVLGPEHRFTTTVVSPKPGVIVLVGGGDPMLASAPVHSTSLPRADLVTLAKSTATTLLGDGTTSVRLAYDDSLFTGPATSPAWPASYVTEDVVSPVAALRVDEGRLPQGGRDLSPGLTAAQRFAAALRTAGVEVAPRIRHGKGSGTELAHVESAPLRQIVEHTLETSDNDAAEVLAHQVGAEDGDGSFDGGVAGVRKALTDLEVPLDGVTLHDGSGLSRSDVATPAALTAVLRLAATDPDLQVLSYGLPVAGFSGSLAGRYTDNTSDAGLGVVRAKTGTLTGVSSLAGFITTASGAALTYVVMADKVPVANTLKARESLDDAAAALAACPC